MQICTTTISNRYVLTLALILAGVGFAADPVVEWQPADPPDPERVLDEAREDRNAGRYELALQKHVWYHENALKYRRSLYGVRLSFALYDWQVLSNRYPPALDKLEQIRDQAEESVRTNREDAHAFHDFVALNRTLKEGDRTVSLFKWLDANDPELANRVYSIAEDALVGARNFDLCSRYIVDPAKDFDALVSTLDRSHEMAKGRPALARTLDTQQSIYAHKAALLVAILANADRRNEAKQIADRAIEKFTADHQVRKIRDAEKGIVPSPIY